MSLVLSSGRKNIEQSELIVVIVLKHQAKILGISPCRLCKMVETSLLTDVAIK